MNRKLSIIFTLLLAFLVHNPVFFADVIKVFTLKDGSVIKGQLADFHQGIYLIQSAHLGQVRLNEADVISITNEGAAPAATSPTTTGAGNIAGVPLTGQMSAMRNEILTNPQLNQQVQQLAQDPTIVQIFSDPAFMQELMQAMSGQDPSVIQNNPKFQQLLANPALKGFIDQMYQRQQNQSQSSTTNAQK